MHREISVFETPDHLARACARLIVEVGSRSIREKGYFSLVLAGGSTPVATYELLADEFSHSLDWARAHVFFGDERCVPPEDARSNYRLAKERLWAKIDLPGENVHRIKGELPPQEAARSYQEEIRIFFQARGALPQQEPPGFDFILLGMGSDGHTASLFPGDESLEEREKWVVWTPHDGPPEPRVARVTLTLPILNAGRWVVFLAAGAGKARRVAQVLGEQGSAYPAGRVTGGAHLCWYLDQEAAQEIPKAS